MPLGTLQHYTIEPSDLEYTRTPVRLDHIAFAASDVGGVGNRLKSNNVRFREQVVPRTGDTQVFPCDPDGVGVELNFLKT